MRKSRTVYNPEIHKGLAPTSVALAAILGNSRTHIPTVIKLILF